MSPEISLSNGAIWYFAFLFSTTMHEASHALAALKLGDDTAHRGGQVTMDPIPHIRREPLGMVIVPIVSYIMGGWMIGWASAPYDPEWARRNPRRAGWMALAGPAANLLICLAAVLLIQLGVWFGWFEAPATISATHIVAAKVNGLGELATRVRELAAVFLSVFFYLNLLLFTFNLIPLPPLDGSNVPLLCLSDSASAAYTALMRAPGVSMVGLILAWQLFGPVEHVIFNYAIQCLYPGVHYTSA
jgi:Zn-dependent protease